jgi:hypothetical protein
MEIIGPSRGTSMTAAEEGAEVRLSEHPSFHSENRKVFSQYGFSQRIRVLSGTDLKESNILCTGLARELST